VVTLLEVRDEAAADLSGVHGVCSLVTATGSADSRVGSGLEAGAVRASSRVASQRRLRPPR